MNYLFTLILNIFFSVNIWKQILKKKTTKNNSVLKHAANNFCKVSELMDSLVIFQDFSCNFDVTPNFSSCRKKKEMLLSTLQYSTRN